MDRTKLPSKAGETFYYPLPKMYETSLTVVSYLSSDPNVGGTYKKLFSPAVASASNKKGLEGLVSKFINENYSNFDIPKYKNIGEKIAFLEKEGYEVAPLFISSNGKEYSAIAKNGFEEAGGIITSRGSVQQQAEMLANEMNGKPFVFSILYQNTKTTQNDLSHPLYAVVSMDEVKEAAEQISLKESKNLAKLDWHNMKSMSDDCKKNCWMEAVSQNAEAFKLVPDEIRGNQWSIIAAIKKSHNPTTILACAKEGVGLVRACENLLRSKGITFEQLPKSLQLDETFKKYDTRVVKGWSPERNVDMLPIKNKNVEVER